MSPSKPKISSKIKIFQEFLVKALKFGIVGIVATVVYAVIGLALTWLEFNLFASHTIALVISLLVSYFGQKIYTFKLRDNHGRVGFRFVIATAGVVAGQYALVFALNLFGVADEFVILASTLYYPPISFLVHTFWTFKT